MGGKHGKHLDKWKIATLLAVCSKTTFGILRQCLFFLFIVFCQLPRWSPRWPGADVATFVLISLQPLGSIFKLFFACADLCRPSLQSFFWSPFDGWKEKQNICWNELNLKCLQGFAGLIVDEQYPEICSTISTSVQNVQKHFVFFNDVKFSSWSGEITTTYSPSSSFSVSVRQVSVAFVSTNSTNVALSPTWPLHYVYIWSDKGHRWSPGWWDGVVTH